ncbi:RagB/SusD family nutrient uptake outer membrane protein [Sunxiuqinia sp. A32]|uniref:RagB/SusD family nutrient uptake outer membrane protein n=1 Tax=Sunxiuqinia sp. A32 TaxID=3461496 RepID=UPI004045C341
MKRINIYIVVLFAFLFVACESILEPEVYSESNNEQIFDKENGIEAVLYGAYAKVASMKVNDAGDELCSEESMTDVLFMEAGAISAWCSDLMNFTLDGVNSRMYSVFWNIPYQGIRNCNLILENIDGADISDDVKELLRAEARFVRAWAYNNMYFRFGPTPLRTNSTQELYMPRATDEEMRTFIETELTEVIEDLPNPGEESNYGRAHKAAAMGLLTKYYLNTKQWQKCADMAKEIEDKFNYDLYPSYFDMFKVANERNEEYIWVRQSKADAGRTASLTLMNYGYPDNFSYCLEPEYLEVLGRNFGTNILIRTDFYNSFEVNDERRKSLITSYVDNKGKTIQLANAAPFKYWPSEDVISASYGNDIPVIRFADILLSRAEALNELDGPNQESIDLINKIRTRAGLTGVNLADFTQETLRDHILKERGWEFYLEGKRREDLIRHGKFISQAQARGLPAQDHMVLYPIPVGMKIANPELEQNPGYNF